jgi:hypothetical protein
MSDPVVLICRSPGRRTLLEPLIRPAEVHASAVEAVLAVTRRTTRAVVLNLEDMAGGERDLLGALRRARPETRLYTVVAPEDEPLARSIVRDGLAADYFVAPGDINRLPAALAGESAPPHAGVRDSSADQRNVRLAEASCELAGLAMANPAVLLRNGGTIILRALGAARGCVLAKTAPTGKLTLCRAIGADGAADDFEMERAVAERAVLAGEPLLLEMAGAPVLCLPVSESGEPFGAVCLARKIEPTAIGPMDRRLAEPLVRALAGLLRAAGQRDVFAKLAQRDAETGLLQLEAFQAYLGRLLARAAAEAAEVGVVLMRPSADGLPSSAESLGAIGRMLASRLAAGCMGGRLSTDCFAVTWARRRGPGLSAADSRRSFLAQAGTFADLGLFGQSAPRLRMSLAVYPPDGSDATALMAAAERGLA